MLCLCGGREIVDAASGLLGEGVKMRIARTSGRLAK